MMRKELQDELNRLELRHLTSRAKNAKPKEERAIVVPVPDTEKPEIHVHVDMPEVKKEETKSPKKWTFRHKYDIHGKLTETMATCE